MWATVRDATARLRHTDAMKRWRECRSERERRAALVEAMNASAGNVQRAAVLLGISCRWLTQLLRRNRLLAEKSVPTEQPESSDRSVSGDPGEKATLYVPLTYKRADPSFPRMTAVVGSAENAADSAKARRGVVLTIEGCPKEIKDWLERKALARKQRTGGRFAISPIAVEIFLEAMARDEEGRE